MSKDLKDLYDLGEVPPLGHVPERMHAFTIRRERYGEPRDAFAQEVVPVPELRPGHVLVYTMAAGINYNNIWAAMGHPADVIAAREKAGATEDYHIGGSDGSGVVWAVGEGVRGVEVGDHVIISPGQWDESSDDIRMGRDPIASRSMRVWGYEHNYGSFGQFSLVQDVQCHRKPDTMTWEVAGGFLVSAATSYRQLFGWEPNVVRPGDPVLIWGGAGGLGSSAIQLARQVGGRPIAVVSTPEKAEVCRELGAVGTILRTDFDHWGRVPDESDTQAYAEWMRGVREFGKRFWQELGERRAPRIVFEHTGADTLPTSLYLCDNSGMVVICGATSGFQADIDLRFLWMRLKRLQGSHFASPAQCRMVIDLVANGQLDPCVTKTVPFDEIGVAHQLLRDNQQPPGNMAALVNAAPGQVGIDL
ncbi:crotonyl-CoA carboxylase/reductase [Nocardiopsis sp. B62]|jgi:crotonyl-CoA carboxylase/reductase|uniref:crotonyl-CoA carboxylase/reductase n=1 Tax=Nocardiopsis sp. B62 TaxID=2824874 RepID=UPI001B3893E4|nr:crotonyl-CoA carboxylase/reductase [Nocardiopsis sp. B62]MBQ1082678.1 crotonyl-CoA carboxylase/reductase [Nocardiopsis sp. B62]